MAEFPRTIDDISQEWVDGRLAESGHAVSADGLNAGPLANAVGFQGNFAHLTFTPAGDGGFPNSLVLKMVPENEQLRGLGRQLAIYAREAAFYGQIGAAAGLPVAACLGLQIDEDTGDSAILLEDLSALRTGNQYAGFTRGEAERAISQYARMHARWWKSPKLSEFDWLPPWNMPEMVAFIPTAFPPAWETCASLYGDRLSTEDRDLAALLGDKLADLMNHAGSGPVTLVHGDARHDNLMFPDGDGEPPRFVDWQYVASGRGMLDIAYYLTQGGEADLVAPIERELVGMYHDTLVAEGVGGYDLDACWADYRRFALYMLVFPIFTAAMIDPESAEQRDGLYIILRRGFDAAKRLNSAELVSG